MTRRACFLLPHYAASGGIRHILEYAVGLRRRGWEVRVRCIGTWETVHVPTEPETLGKWWGGYKGCDLRFETGSIRALRPRVDEVVITFGDAPNEVFLSSIWRKSPRVLLVLDWLAFHPTRQLGYMRQSWSALMCSTPYLAKQIKKEIRVDATVIGAGVGDTFYPEPRRRSHRPGLGSLYATSISKGFPDVLEAAERVALALSTPVDVYLYGDPEFGPDYKSHLVDVHYTQRPDPEKLRDIYNSCDIWLCTSRSEGFGFPSLEAFACGIPVVSYKNGGESYFLRDGVNGYVVPVLDIDTFSARVIDLLLDEPTRSRLAAAALVEARTHTWERSTDLFEGVLTEALVGSP